VPDPAQRSEPDASPLRAATLSGLPPAVVLTAEHDVLRDEGEAYARRLLEADVRVTSLRYNHVLHDFMMLNPIRPTAAASGAVAQAIDTLRTALGTR
jgi:acetyl esterase